MGLGDQRRHPVERVLLVASPVLVGVLFGTALLLGTDRPRADLELLAPTEVRPGQSFAVRALVLGGLGEDSGLALEPQPVWIRLSRAEDGPPEAAPLAEVRLEPGPPGSGMAGSLRVPATTRGPVRLVARTDSERVETIVTVSESAGAPGAEPRGLGPLHEARLLDLVPTGAGSAPSRVLPRVVGGACVPEFPCRIVVWVGEPAATIVVEPTASVRGESLDGADERSGLVALDVRVHGLDAELRLRVERDGIAVAHRIMRLPIVPAMPHVSLDPSIGADRIRPVLRAEATLAGAAFVVDTFHDGRWVRAGTLTPGTPASVSALSPGLWRFQIRTSVLSTPASTAARLIFVTEADTSEEQRLTGLAATLDASDPYVARVRAGESVADGPVPRRAAYLLAPLEAWLVPEPEPVRSLTRETEALEAEGVRARRVLAVLVFLVGLLATAVVFRRGRRAAREARALMAKAGAKAPAARDRFGLLGAVLVLVLIFSAVAALILAK